MQAIDASMGVVPPEQEELTGEAWTAEVERRLQQMYEKGTYDPTPINLSAKVRACVFLSLILFSSFFLPIPRTHSSISSYHPHHRRSWRGSSGWTSS